MSLFNLDNIKLLKSVPPTPNSPVIKLEFVLDASNFDNNLDYLKTFAEGVRGFFAEGYDISIRVEDV